MKVKQAPSVFTDEKGEATLQFFFSEINSGFVIEAEGITKDGLPGSDKLEFMVLKAETSADEK